MQQTLISHTLIARLLCSVESKAIVDSRLHPQCTNHDQYLTVFMIKQNQVGILLRHIRREWALLSFHSVCLSVWMFVGHSATYSLPQLIDHNQICSAGIYLSSDPCKPFWIPYLPYFRCQRENMQNFAYFQHVNSESLQTYSSNEIKSNLFAQIYHINIGSSKSVHEQGQQGWKQH